MRRTNKVVITATGTPEEAAEILRLRIAYVLERRVYVKAYTRPWPVRRPQSWFRRRAAALAAAAER